MLESTAPSGLRAQFAAAAPRLDVDVGRMFGPTRAMTETIADGLLPEDQVVQSMPDASPTKWHLAHTTWFFETFLLVPYLAGYRVFDERWNYLFNSYYDAVGARHPRPERGLLSRPGLAEVLRYRSHVDAGMVDLLAGGGADDSQVAALTHLGIHHEQQHQELILTDILHLFAGNPLAPAYRPPQPHLIPEKPQALAWIDYGEGLHEIGCGGDGFAFDNERPRHRLYLNPFRLASRLVTNGEWRDFIDDGGYRRAGLWLSDGWAMVAEKNVQTPLYWQQEDGRSQSMTLRGMRPIEDAAPVCHVSFYEADAYARWAGCRLPTEAEWEVAASSLGLAGNTLGSGALLPLPAANDGHGASPAQMYGDVWEWTASAYTPYPGYRPPAGAVGEYNGKFMCNQMVLRGGSCVTPDGHIRASYRNFFYPHQRWQFTGVRLAKDG
jgi:ergothioneine biosynthesis protein EgtB